MNVERLLQRMQEEFVKAKAELKEVDASVNVYYRKEMEGKADGLKKAIMLVREEAEKDGDY